MRLRTLVLIVVVAVVLAFLVLIVTTDGRQGGKFAYTIDPAVQPDEGRRGDRPLAAVRDQRGRTSVFVVDEIILSPVDAAELEAFLADHEGAVVATDAVPAPPPGSGITLDPGAVEPTQYTVRLDPSSFPLEGFGADAAKVGIAGEVVISSEPGARLLALATQARAGGIGISPNFVGYPAEILVETEEHPVPGGFENAFAMPQFAGVVPAWQLMAARDATRDLQIAVIDGGFWLDATGRPMSSGGVSDLPPNPRQYDFINDDRIAAGANAVPCTPAARCLWHGNGSAGVATGILDNRYGAAGTGGLVATPMLFSSTFTSDQVARAIRTAVNWDADVISMSFGRECDVVCDGFREFSEFPALRNARDRGVVTVAAAGNDGWQTNSVPCKGDEVICVGMLRDGTNTAWPASNFGPLVDIWAPTNIPVMPDGGAPGVRGQHTGTSAAAPYVAGVVAMMQACQPGLPPAEYHRMLQATARTGSPDPKVTRSVDPFAAVSLACGAPPTLEVDPPSAANAPYGRDLVFTATVFDVEDGTPCTACRVEWEPAGVSGGRLWQTYRFPGPGGATVRVTATDTDGNITFVEVLIDVVNTPPTAYIDQPSPGAAVPRGSVVALSGFGLDPNEGPGPEPGRLDRGCAWTSDRAGDALPPASCAADVTFTTSGPRRLRLTVEDSLGAVSRAVETTIEVVDPPPDPGPSATMTLPPPNYYDHYAAEWPIELTGDASGDPDRPYTWEWAATSYEYGGTSEVAAGPIVIGGSRILTWVPLDTRDPVHGDLIRAGNRCYEGQWVRITLRATDSLGNPGPEAARLVRVACVFR